MPAESRIIPIDEPAGFGIIAGSGTLFSMVLAHAVQQGLNPVVVSFKDITPQEFDTPLLQTTLGKIGEVLQFLKTHNVKQLIFAGRIPRPSFSSLNFDSTGLRWMQKLSTKAFGGDDALLQAITALLQAEGFEIISPREFLPNLVLKPGIYTKTQANDQDDYDINRGEEVLKTLSDADVGQACIVQEGLVLGIEAIEGTQALIERCAPLKRIPKGGVLVKLAKINQSTLVDLPTIGTGTVEAARECTLNGIAISSNTTQVLEFNKVVDLCDRYNMFLKVI